MLHFKLLVVAVIDNGHCCLHLFITLAAILQTSGERIEASPLGSSLAPNMGIGSFDHIPPLTTTHVLTHLYSRITGTTTLPSVCFLLAWQPLNKGVLFPEEGLREGIKIMTGTFKNVEWRKAKCFVAALGRYIMPIIGLM